MAKMTKEMAIKLLGNYAYHKQTKVEMTSRINKLISFASECNSTIEIRINNSWGKAPGKYQNSKLIGGTTYKYQVWAVA